jgi:hypothetical protein
MGLVLAISCFSTKIVFSKRLLKVHLFNDYHLKQEKNS